ncbi:cytoplasmic protein [Colletotrichum sojae]|uniref:Cytoplasmic protein n=1 Tax=Colletotrichum sojae TaxID=2175907 RepID=A0A8H6JQM7_9PEZI|nr:cytoplasmic protein [Colletotrichum sojae]
MAKTPEQQFLNLEKTDGNVEESAVAAVYEQLKPVVPEFLVGQWEGGSFDTGHPTHQTLREFKWAGKDFRSVDDVDPVMFYDQDRKRTWLKEYGHARVREVKYRGVVTAAMVYDKYPIIDSFRLVDENTVMGAMDSKELRDAGTYYFYLKRRPESKA